MSGEFNERARAAIYEIGSGRCLGCGRTDLTAQHRRPRGMGGTSDVTIGHPANGVPLCGDGIRGCHGWTEKNRTDGLLLGWLLAAGEPAVGTPFWSFNMGWRSWHVDDTGFPSTVYVDEIEDLDRVPERLAAVERFRIARPRPKPNAGLKDRR